MRHLFGFLAITFSLIGCDTWHGSRICNQTGQDLKIEIRFDLEYLRQNEKLSPQGQVRKFHERNEGLMLVSIDTVGFVGQYLIKADSCGTIEFLNSVRPHFHKIRELIIYTSDTLRYGTREEILKAFDSERENPEYSFDLVVKNPSR
jgi:hypothetical protein